MPRLIRRPYAASTIALMALMLGSSACSVGSILGDFDLCSGGPDAIASITMQPAQTTLRVGDTMALVATHHGTNGESFLLCAPPWSWVSANPAVATIVATDGSGVVRAVAIGTTVVSARSGGKSASSTITVSDVGIASLHSR